MFSKVQWSFGPPIARFARPGFRKATCARCGCFLVAALLMSGAAKLAVAYYSGSAHPSGAVQWVSDVLFFLWVTPAVVMFLPLSVKEPSEIDWQRILDLVQVAVVSHRLSLLHLRPLSLRRPRTTNDAPHVAGPIDSRRGAWCRLFINRSESLRATHPRFLPGNVLFLPRRHRV